ncbi:hypothetical protein CEXT_383541 [Caerostris extrusa]|uniref:Uncharacterized protein n=1 Tax=Caerostris extrusa TaxID=172846 RepID=A0AAV4SWH9_CAEEX|nr:hypothetical protein CEXT_383541 [Caerostris extrusa]
MDKDERFLIFNPGLNLNPNSIHTWKEFNHCWHLLNLTDQFVATDVIPDLRYFLNPSNKTEASSIAPGHDTVGERHTFRRVIKMGRYAYHIQFLALTFLSILGDEIVRHTALCAHVLGIDLNRSSR